MARLGDRFADSEKRQYASRQLTPSRVIYLYCDFTKTPKDKYLVLVCRRPRPLFFFINSSIPRFIENNPDTRACQVSINASDYGFLRHDSFIDCSRVIHSATVNEVINELAGDLSRIKGALGQSTIAEIMAVVREAKTISRSHKRAIATALGSADVPVSGQD